MYKDRIEIQNPGGLFGRISINLLGKKKNYDARNPNIIRFLEDMEIVENRGNFIVTFFGDSEQVSEQDKLLRFLANPRTKKEISDFLGISSLRYLKEAYLSKLLEQDLIV